MEEIDYTAFRDGRLPDYMEDGVRRWIERGAPTGHFLTAVISNNLFDAFGRADPQNAAAMREWVRFFYNRAPRGCWGSPEAAREWRAHRGLQGLAAA